MCGICYQQYLAYAEAGRTSLLQFVRAHTDELVIARLGIAGKNLLIAHGLALHDFLSPQLRIVAICDPPQAIGGNFSGHVPVGGVADEVGVPVAEALVEGKVDLDYQHRRAEGAGRRHTLVATICCFSVSPGYSLPKSAVRTPLDAPSAPTM